MAQPVAIRPIQEGDLLEILNLIKALATYEKAEGEVVVSLEELKEDFRNRIFEAQIAETADGRVVGMVLYYMTYSTWKGKMLYLEDFFVLESHRGQGIGRRLFDAVIEAARKAGCRLLKWQVLDWNTPAIDFYTQNYNARIESDWLNGKLFLSEDTK